MTDIRLSRSLCVVASLALVACGGTGQSDSTEQDPIWQEAFPTFTKHEIEFDGASYGTSIDVDGDGARDVVALSQSTIVWFRSPTWERFDITSASERYIYMAPYDVDGDGDLDLAVASEFALDDSSSGGLISWLENPDDPTMSQAWIPRRIDAIPASHRLRWGDIDGDGTKELLNLPIVGIGAVGPEYVGASQLKAYWISPDPTGPWDGQVLDDSRLEVAHGFIVVDWDGDAMEDILTASQDGVMLFQPGLGGEPRHIAAGLDAGRPNRGSSEVSLGSLGGERFIATIDPWHGTDAVIHSPGASETDIWSRRVIGTEFEGGHGLVAADLNGDGFDEVIGGGRGDGGTLIIYRYVPSSMSWERIPLDVGGVGTSSAEVHDIDGDGDLDILVAGASTDNVVWYENSM